MSFCHLFSSMRFLNFRHSGRLFSNASSSSSSAAGDEFAFAIGILCDIGEGGPWSTLDEFARAEESCFSKSGRHNPS